MAMSSIAWWSSVAVLLAMSSSPVQPISGVSQAWENIAVFVQLLVDGRRPHAYFRVVAVEVGEPHGSCQQADETQLAGSMLLQAIDRGNGGVAGREHWIDHDHESLR